jgi:mono/diheme cytochrome c family protein
MKIVKCVLVRLMFWAVFWLVLLLTGAFEAQAQPSRQTLLLGEEVYHVNCAVCHGVGGDGNGPAAAMFRIRPRDFRPGIFKFRSTPSSSLPSDDDLLWTVSQGLRWTGMIGRSDLGETSGRAMIQYLKTFSTRFTSEKPGNPIAVPSAPRRTQEMLEEGSRLYKEVGCNSCHGEQGRGDGPAGGALKDDWGWKIWPSDLTWRPLKRGSDPAGVYLTLATGLSGTPMPSFASSLNSRQIWSLVYYLEGLVPPNHRLNPNQFLGEERQGWMAVSMGGMMGGMMGRGMMR